MINISVRTYSGFTRRYPKLSNIGIDNFHTKIWILLSLHEKDASMRELSQTRCKSLLKECAEYEDLLGIVDFLKGEKIIYHIQSKGIDVIFGLDAPITFEITKLKNDAEEGLLNNSVRISALGICYPIREQTTLVQRAIAGNSKDWKTLYPVLKDASVKAIINFILYLIKIAEIRNG